MGSLFFNKGIFMFFMLLVMYNFSCGGVREGGDKKIIIFILVDKYFIS